MLKDIVFYSFAVTALVNTVHFGFYIAGANIYDIVHARKKKRASKQKGLRPLVSVLIPAHNEEKGIIRTLESVRKSSYRKIEIIIIDDASTDATRKLVWRYIQKHPNRSIRLLRKQTNVGKGEALNHALRRAEQLVAI